MELRERRRYRLSLPVKYFWGEGERLLEGSGSTRDISVCSVYVKTQELLPTGSDVWLQVAVPPIKEGARGSKLEGTGRVVRSDARGFAAVASIGFPVDLFSECGEEREEELPETARRKAASLLGIGLRMELSLSSK